MKKNKPLAKARIGRLEPEVTHVTVKVEKSRGPFQVIGKVLSWPFRTVHEWVDTRPDINSVREHLAAQDLYETKTPDGVQVNLLLRGTDKVRPVFVEGRSTDYKSPGELSAFVDGVAAGAELIIVDVAEIRGSDIRKERKAVKLATAAKKKSRRVQVRHVEEVPEAVLQPS